MKCDTAIKHDFQMASLPHNTRQNINYYFPVCYSQGKLLYPFIVYSKKLLLLTLKISSQGTKLLMRDIDTKRV